MPPVVRTASAREDLKQIGRYIAQQSQSLSLAMRFLDRIDQKCKLYAANPEMGTLRTDLGPTVRCFSVSEYVIFYETHGRGIRVLLVIHGSMDILSVFRDRIGKSTN